MRTSSKSNNKNFKNDDSSNAKLNSNSNIFKSSDCTNNIMNNNKQFEIIVIFQKLATLLMIGLPIIIMIYLIHFIRWCNISFIKNRRTNTFFFINILN